MAATQKVTVKKTKTITRKAGLSASSGGSKRGRPKGAKDKKPRKRRSA